MRITEGTCAHCGAHVVWSEHEGCYVSPLDKSTTCHPATDPHNVPKD